MNTITHARNSNAVQRAKKVPVLRASALGDAAFISFIADQAESPAGAPRVIREMKGYLRAGYRLDNVLRQLLAMANATVARTDPSVSDVFVH